jgi:hypothetical protein
LGISGHADAVIAEAVEEQNGVLVRMVRIYGPGAEGDVVRCGDGRIGQFGVEGVGRLANSAASFSVSERRAGWRVPSAM